MSTGSSAVVVASSVVGVVLPSEVVELAKVTTTEGLSAGHSCVAAPSIGAAEVRDGSLAAAEHIRACECECGHLSARLARLGIQAMPSAATLRSYHSSTSVRVQTDVRQPAFGPSSEYIRVQSLVNSRAERVPSVTSATAGRQGVLRQIKTHRNARHG